MKARGAGFFAAAETAKYEPLGSVVGQFTPDSCVAACCRMLLRDYAADVVEAHLRVVLDTNFDGSFVSQAPAALLGFGLQLPYVYLPDLSLDELRAAVALAPAIVVVQVVGASDWHALLVDGFEADRVLIRDPLPMGIGAAYKVSLATFSRVWTAERNKRGPAVIVVK